MSSNNYNEQTVKLKFKEIIGAIGVSGGHVKQDVDVVKAALENIKEDKK